MSHIATTSSFSQPAYPLAFCVPLYSSVSACARKKRPLMVTTTTATTTTTSSPSSCLWMSSEYDDDEGSGFINEDEYFNKEISDQELFRQKLSRVDDLEDMLFDIERDLEDFLDEEELENGEDLELDEADFDSDGDDVDELLSLLEQAELEDIGEDSVRDKKTKKKPSVAMGALENALLQGVVPAAAGVGSDCLPGDWGFDPLQLSKKDWIYQSQSKFLVWLGGEEPPEGKVRPPALVLRDYREAEIRHGRLAMLAAMIWPVQEMLDQLLLDEDQFGALLRGPVTLPYFPLFMTLCMMLLGYLDIFAKAIKDRDDIGDAFLPGDCFWDPLNVLEGAPDRMKRNMQERELFNGRVAMIAIAAYSFEELTTGKPLIEVEGNELLFMPAYQIPYIQEWLDVQFSPTL